MSPSWKRKFTDRNLLRGYDLFDYECVYFSEIEQRDSDIIMSFSVEERYDEYEVDVILGKHDISWRCECNKKACLHAAAALYSVEEMGIMEEETRAELLYKMCGFRYVTEEEIKKQNEQVDKLYKKIFPEDTMDDEDSLVDFNMIEKVLFEDREDKLKALKLCKSEQFSCAYKGQFQIADIPVACYESTYPDGKHEQQSKQSLYISKIALLEAKCTHSECYSKNRNYYLHGSTNCCPHIKALYYFGKSHIKTKDGLDATSMDCTKLLQYFHTNTLQELTAKTVTAQGVLSLVPKLKDQGDQKLKVQFRVGETRLYVVKNIGEFVQNIKANQTMTFGKNNTFRVGRDNFTPDSLPVVDFLFRQKEEADKVNERFREGLGQRYYYYDYSVFEQRLGGELPLIGQTMDEFFDAFPSGGVEYECTKEGEKISATLMKAEVDPKLTMRIEPLRGKNKKSFNGVRASMTLPLMLKGNKSHYYIADGKLCRLSNEFLEALGPFLNMEKNSENEIVMTVGKRYLSDFYNVVLPKISDFVTVTETNAEEIEQYLPEELQFEFYLDSHDQDIFCRAKACYGAVKYSLHDVFDQGESELDSMRVSSKEIGAATVVMEYLPVYQQETDEFHCFGEEERMFQFLEDGVEALLTLGEVHATEAFKNLKIHKKVPVSVGVSVGSGVLDLSVTSENLSAEELLAILDSYRQKKKYHKLKNGSFVNAQDDSIAMLAELFDTTGVKSKEFLKGKIKIPMFRSLYLDKLLEENDGVYEERDQKFKSMVKEFKTVSDSDFQAPKTLSKVLRNYQKVGYKWFRILDTYGFGGILADDMGLGKTLQSIAFLLALHNEEKRKKIKTSLIVCPASLVYNWGDEFQKFAPELNVGLLAGGPKQRQEILEKMEEYDVLVTSYHLLHGDIAEYEGRKFRVQIIDEAQNIKNQNTGMAKAVKTIEAQTKLALTGTPIENRLSELWSIFDYLMPGFLYRYEGFKRDFETKIAKYQDKEVAERLKRMVRPFILRRLKTDVLKDIPDKLEKVYHVRMNKKQQELYDAQVVHLKQTVGAESEEEFSKNKLKVLAELTKLRQICCDPSLCFENYDGESAKREACIEVVKNAIEAGHRILLFSQFTSMLELLEGNLKKEGIEFYKITGKTPKQERLRLVKEFNAGEVPVFLISLKAGGTGLNLVGADCVIHYDPWWNVAVQNQATDRAHRIGQERKVTVFKMIIKNTIEDKIVALQDAKKNLADEILSGEGESLSKMSKEDLLELLG